MSHYEDNVYYHPEVNGLELLGELDERDLSYEYNKFIVLKHTESGRVFWVSNSGCSCPTPFEDYFFKGPDNTNLEEVTLYSWNAFEAAVKSWSIGYDDQPIVPQHERDEFVDNVRRVVKGRL